MKQTHADELAKKEYMIKSLQNDLQKAKENDNKSKDKLEAEIKNLAAKADEITKKNEELLKQNEELTKKREKETLSVFPYLRHSFIYFYCPAFNSDSYNLHADNIAWPALQRCKN